MADDQYIPHDPPEYITATIRPVYDDFAEWQHQLKTSTSQFVRRAYVRSAFALLETTVNYFAYSSLKMMSLDLKPSASADHIAKMYFLSEDSFKVDEKGKVKSSKNFMRFVNRIAFVMRAFVEANGKDASILFSDPKWKRLQLAVEIRNRITHPKRAEHLDVTDEDLAIVLDSIAWLFTATQQALPSLPEDLP